VRLGEMGTILESDEPVLQVRLFDVETGERISMDKFAADRGMDEPLFRGTVMSSYRNGEWARAESEYFDAIELAHGDTLGPCPESSGGSLQTFSGPKVAPQRPSRRAEPMRRSGKMREVGDAPRSPRRPSASRSAACVTRSAQDHSTLQALQDALRRGEDPERPGVNRPIEARGTRR